MIEPCVHPDFEARVDVYRLTDDGSEADLDAGAMPDRYAADVKVWCVACRVPFTFAGLPLGVSPRHPTVSVDGLELHAPLAPRGEGAKPGGLGYTIRVSPAPRLD